MQRPVDLVEGQFVYFIATPWFLGYENVMAGAPTVVAVDVVFPVTVAL